MFSLLALSVCLSSYAKGDAAQIMSTPSPAVSNKPVEIKITTSNMGSEVYCYTWCKNVGGQEKTPTWGWDDVHTAKFRMSGSNGTYTLTISNIQEFYGLSDSELAGLSCLGFIAKTPTGQQTEDLTIDVVQGRRDAYSGGEGTSASPFILTKKADLQALASTPADWTTGVYFRMDADIDVAGLATGIGSSSTPFSADFDGNGHTVKNLVLTSNTIGSPTGLFNCVDGGKIHNLGVIDAHITGTTFTGILVGQLKSGVVERCFTAGIVRSSSICAGGLAGENINGEIRNCYSGAKVSNPADYVSGGLVGKNTGKITNAYTAGAITGYDYVGGLAGANYGNISHCVAMNASVLAMNEFGARFGGNNNSRNAGEGNHSWDNMTAESGSWSAHGDHATTKESGLLQDRNHFMEITGWDFNNVWEWRVEGQHEYPVLRSISNQGCYLSDSYFDGGTSSESIVGIDTEALIVAGPNPTEGMVYISSVKGLSEYMVYDLSGKIAYQGNGMGMESVSLDLSSRTSGIYILHVCDVEGNHAVKKIIKK